MKLWFFGFVVLLALPLFAQKTLTSEDILKMVQGGVTQGDIITAIAEAPSVQFNLMYVTALTNGGVPDNVVRAMAARAYGRPIPGYKPSPKEAAGRAPEADSVNDTLTAPSTSHTTEGATSQVVTPKAVFPQSTSTAAGQSSVSKVKDQGQSDLVSQGHTNVVSQGQSNGASFDVQPYHSGQGEIYGSVALLGPSPYIVGGNLDGGVLVSPNVGIIEETTLFGSEGIFAANVQGGVRLGLLRSGRIIPFVVAVAGEIIAQGGGGFGHAFDGGGGGGVIVRITRQVETKFEFKENWVYNAGHFPTFTLGIGYRGGSTAR